MRLNEVIKKTGLSKKAVHLYIQKGLIFPNTDDNGYYNFSENDVQILKRIRMLRELDIPLKEIEITINDPRAGIYILIKHRRNLQNKASLLNYECAMLEEMEDRLSSGMPFTDVVDTFWDSHSMLYVDKEAEPLNDSDADLIIHHFFGNHMSGVPKTEYRIFLKERLKKYILTHQTKQVLAFRDYLLSLDSSDIISEYMMSEDEDYSELIYLTSEDYPFILKKVISSVKKNLSSPMWLVQWRHYYYKYQKPATEFYCTEVNNIMRELSPTFGSYSENVNIICQMFYDYLMSDEGSELKKDISGKLDGYIDIECNGHTELIGLYLFKAKTI